MIIKRKQKDYSLVSDLYHSGIKRTGKKYIGRARVKIANALQRSIDKDNKKGNIARLKMYEVKDKRQELVNNLAKEAEKLDTATVPQSALRKLSEKFNNGEKFGMSCTNRAQDIKEAENNIITDLLIRNHKNAVIVGEGQGTIMAYPHELGHIKHGIDTNGESFEIVGNAKKNIEKSVKSNSILGGLRAFKEHGKLLKEEKIANKNAIQFLKNAGATKEEIEEARKEMKSARITYKVDRNIDTKSAIRNKFELKKWKGNTRKRIERDLKRKKRDDK